MNSQDIDISAKTGGHLLDIKANRGDNFQAGGEAVKIHAPSRQSMSEKKDREKKTIHVQQPEVYQKEGCLSPG